jgi:uncharacterized membrane protein
MADSMRLVVCTFDAADRAAEVREIMQKLDARLDTIRLGNIAVVQKTAGGQISFRESHDIRNELSEIAGIVASGLTWLAYAIVGGVAPAAGQMAGIDTKNAVAAQLRDHGFSDEALHEVGERLSAGESALLALVRPDEEPVVVAELERLGGTIQAHGIAPELAAELERHES